MPARGNHLALAMLLAACGSAPRPSPARATRAPAREAAPAPEAVADTPVAMPEGLVAGPFGTAHPSVVAGVDERGRWLVLCQAREDTDGDGRVEVSTGYHGEMFGDRLQAYLFLAPGEGEAIDELLGVSDDGDVVAFRRGTQVSLLDVTTGQRTALSGEGPLELSTDGRVLFRRRSGDRVDLVVRRLADGSEQRIATGPGLLWRASFMPGAAWLRVDMVRHDTNGDGRIEAPQLQTTLAPRQTCSPAPAVYSTYGWRGDQPEILVVPSTGGAPRLLSEIVRDATPLTTMGASFLVRRGDFALGLQRPDGRYEELVPAECRGLVLAFAPSAERVVVQCRTDPRRLEAHTVDSHGSLSSTSDHEYDDDLLESRSPYVLGNTLVDLDTGASFTLPDHQYIQGVVGTRVLYVQARRYRWVDVATEEVRDLGPSRPGSLPRQVGDVVSSGPFTFDVRAGTRIASGQPDGVSLDVFGRRLVPLGPSDYAFATGPFEWLPPGTGG